MAWDYTNDVAGTLSTAYTSGGTSLQFTLTAGALPATTRLFILKVDNEYFLCGAWSLSGGTYTATVAGAQSGSTASNHSSGAVVTGCWVLPQVIDGWRADQSQVGLYAGLPSSGMKAGDRYKPTDSPYEFVYSGTAWVAFRGGLAVTVPGPISAWTWVNQGTSTADDTYGLISMRIATSGSLNWRMLARAAPSAPYKFVCCIKGIEFNVNAQNIGVYFYDGTKLMGMESLAQSGNWYLRVQKMANVNTDSGTFASLPSWFGAAAIASEFYFRLRNDGSTLWFDYSQDGCTFYNLYSESVGIFITPTQVGFGGLSEVGDGSYFVQLTCYSATFS